jgi:hypothetical protein
LVISVGLSPSSTASTLYAKFSFLLMSGLPSLFLGPFIFPFHFLVAESQGCDPQGAEAWYGIGGLREMLRGMTLLLSCASLL